MLWFGAYMVSLNAAERWVDAGTSSLLVNTGPLFIALLAGWLLHEGFPRALLVGCVVALAGAGLIALSVSGHSSHKLIGAGLCVVAALAYALAVVLQKPALRFAGALPVTWLACTAGGIVLLEFVPQSVHELGHASPATHHRRHLPRRRADGHRLPAVGVRAVAGWTRAGLARPPTPCHRWWC